MFHPWLLVRGNCSQMSSISFSINFDACFFGSDIVKLPELVTVGHPGVEDKYPLKNLYEIVDTCNRHLVTMETMHSDLGW
jgi:hypothetical protein